MAKVVKKLNFKTIESGAEGYNDLSGFKEVSAEVGKKGEIGITDTNGSKRVRLSKEIFLVLEEPQMLKVFTTESQMAIKGVADGTPGAFEVKKGAVIYSTDLAEKIMKLAKNVDFQPNCTTRCGHIDAVQIDENGVVSVILSF